MSLVRTEDRGAVRHIVLNRPEKRNALNSETIVELGGAIEAAAADVDVRVVVLRGEGPMFSAGMAYARRDDPHAHGVVTTMLANGAVPSITVVFLPALAAVLHVSGTDEHGDPLSAEVCRYQSNVAPGPAHISH